MNPLNILIIDDNKDLADGLAMVLEEESHKASLAYNGTDGLKKYTEGRFDIVFLDVKLPDMNGMDVFQTIKRENPDTRIIMMTGYRIEQMLSEVINSGDVEILRKPFKINHVLTTLNEVNNESIILIADDDANFSEALSDFLTENGIKTILASNGKDAVDTVLSKPIDVLILDLRMPIINGLDVYMELKKQDRAVNTVIVTGHAEEDTETIDVLRSTSVTGCLFKPFTPDEMLQTIDEIMNNRLD